jgi:LmbE family N-acetylglucosaminyl deacetylase
MPLALKRIEPGRVLVVAPHPDDESIAVGGCLALHRLAGSSVHTVFVTSDRPRKDGKVVRHGEADEASKVLGYGYEFLGVTDGRVSRSEDLVATRIAARIREFRPDFIYCPFPGDHHRDHQAVAASTDVAIRMAEFAGEVWCYETWSSLWPNAGVEISSVVPDKRAAIECYRSQLGMPYVEAVLGLNRYRGLQLGVPFAEGLFVCSPAGFREVCLPLGTL